mmetsp:Transcript_66304/g.153998  ORF Transcript_66304/g.153998 Transcript_66304/m.153998 type:complete len:770 (-) Transcript_66304:150-2459(-)
MSMTLPDAVRKRSALDAQFHRSVAAQSIPMSEAAKRGRCLWFLAGRKPVYMPRILPLDLLFFRRVFSNLHRSYGDNHGEVPLSVFQRSFVRLFRVLDMKDADFEAEEYDADHSGAVGWYEFVSCWRKSQVHIKLSLPERIFLAMEDPSTCFIGQVVNVLVTFLIFVSCILFILGTMPSFRHTDCDDCEPQQYRVFNVLEGTCIAVFTGEYVVRAITAPFARSELLDYERILNIITDQEPMSVPKPLVRALDFMTQPMNVIDIFVILPFYMEQLLGVAVSNFTVLRVLRLTRLFRLVKLGKYFEVLEIIVRVFRRSTKMFYVLGVYLILGICFSSAAMYYVESGSWDSESRSYMRVSHDGKNETTPFISIPHSFWWCIVTFTTVGYGDVVPVTLLGKIVASCTMVAGILVLAMPISVISMNFTEVWAEWNETRRMEIETMQQDMLSVNQALLGMKSREHLLVELWDDRAGGREAPEFLGEVEWPDLPLASCRVEQEDRLLPLQPNWEKKPNDKVSGSVLVGYTWHPSYFATVKEDSDAGGEASIQGTLEVRVQRAEGLPRSDWKKAGMRDVYAVVHCWPRPPKNPAGGVAEKYTTSTTNGLDPVWEEEALFHFDWPGDWQPPRRRSVDRGKSARRSDRLPTWKRRQLGQLDALDLVPTKPVRTSDPGARDGLHEMMEIQRVEIRNLAAQVAEVKEVLTDLRDLRAQLLGIKATSQAPEVSPARPLSFEHEGSPLQSAAQETDDARLILPPNIRVPGSVEVDVGEPDSLRP